MKNKIIILFLCGALVLSGCGATNTAEQNTTETTNGTAGSNAVTTEQTSAKVTTTEGIDVDLTGDYSDTAKDSSYDESSATNISFSGKTVEVDGTGATVEEAVVTITEGGTYIISGEAEEGQIIVEAPEKENVQLVLSGVDLSNSSASPIEILTGKNIFLTIDADSENTITDNRIASNTTENSTAADTAETNDAQEETVDATAAIYSKCDLMINGTGSLTVKGNYNDGITSKDDLEIISGIITVIATDDAIIGKDSISVLDGTLNLAAGGDGLKASNTEDTTKGYVVIDGGEIAINAGDDGIHSETALVINGGKINVENSVEGLESLNIVINDGVINVVSKDDGVNVAGGSDTTSTDSPMRGGGGMDEAIDGALIINGGTITIDASGDGLDSNGSMLIAGGTTTVYGPQDAGNGVIDYNGSMELTGGTLYALGTTGMEQTPSDNSTQTALSINLDSYLESGVEVTVTDGDGKEIASVTTEKSTNFLLISNAELVEGDTYTVSYDGSTTEVTAGEYQSVQGQGMGGMRGGR